MYMEFHLLHTANRRGPTKWGSTNLCHPRPLWLSQTKAMNITGHDFDVSRYTQLFVTNQKCI